MGANSAKPTPDLRRGFRVLGEQPRWWLRGFSRRRAWQGLV